MLHIIITAAILVTIFWSMWYDTAIIAALAVAAYLVFTFLTGDLQYVVNLIAPEAMVIFCVFYLISGALWSLWKWRCWVHSDKVQADLSEAKMKYDREEHTEDFTQSPIFPASAKQSKHVDRITGWIMLWPFSMVVYFFDDLLANVGRWIYFKLGSVYQMITESAIPK